LAIFVKRDKISCCNAIFAGLKVQERVPKSGEVAGEQKMTQQSNRQSSNLASQVGGVVLLVVTFALIGFVALSVVTGNDFGVSRMAGLTGGRPVPVPTPPQAEGTPNPLDTVTFKDTALGFQVQYPRTWQKRQSSLRVILTPAVEETAELWFGIPADGSDNEAELLALVQAELAPEAQQVDQGQVNIGGEQWASVQVNYHDQQSGPMVATIAVTSKARVGYYIAAVAPAEQWNQYQPAYQNILNSFEFTTEAVLRPTDATPPPTPTPTPTPVFHTVQSGDTLSHVSVKYDVSIEAIMDRNGLDESSIIRPGDRLIIPRKRQR
jgi:LysM repeat protein